MRPLINHEFDVTQQVDFVALSALVQRLHRIAEANNHRLFWRIQISQFADRRELNYHFVARMESQRMSYVDAKRGNDFVFGKGFSVEEVLRKAEARISEACERFGYVNVI